MNYIMLNDQRIDLTEDQVKEIERSFGYGQIKLADIEVGKTFKIEGYEFIVLEHSGDTTAVILKDLLHENKQFGESNNYNKSNADDICCAFGEQIETIVGKDNLVEHTVDLTADDGLKCYGSVKRKMSLLTANLYRRYVYILDEFKVNKWWWLCSAYSTPKHNESDWVKCVSSRGIIRTDNIYGRGVVRPFCILKSNILVSKVEE